MWGTNFPREIIPISEMLLKARIGTAGLLLMAFSSGGGSALPTAPHYKLVLQIHSLCALKQIPHLKLKTSETQILHI